MDEKCLLAEGDSTHITEGFRQLGLDPAQYPSFSDPYSFAQTFKICSAYEFTPIYSAQTTELEEAVHAKLECCSK